MRAEVEDRLVPLCVGLLADRVLQYLERIGAGTRVAAVEDVLADRGVRVAVVTALLDLGEEVVAREQTVQRRRAVAGTGRGVTAGGLVDRCVELAVVGPHE